MRPIGGMYDTAHSANLAANFRQRCGKKYMITARALLSKLESVMQSKSRIASARLTLNPERQTIAQINELIAKLAGMAGCLECGQLAFLDVHFLGDPDPGFRDLGVMSFEQNFH